MTSAVDISCDDPIAPDSELAIAADPEDPDHLLAGSNDYQSKTNPSVADMLAKLRRTIVAVQYQPRHAAAPTPQEITAVQQAWAAAAA